MNEERGRKIRDLFHRFVEKHPDIRLQLDHSERNSDSLSESLMLILIDERSKRSGLEGRIRELENIAPRKIIIDGKTFVWRCPENLIPITAQK